MSDPVPLQPGEGVIRCPAVRSLIKNGKLKHEEHDGLQTAAVQELVRAFSGQPRDLAPNEPGSLANVAGFFAIVNHGIEDGAEEQGHGLIDSVVSLLHKGGDAAKVAGGKSTTRRFDLRFLGSKGDHPGTVNFFTDDERGEFQPEKFTSAMAKFSKGGTLTIQGVARMIIEANGADPKASALDLAKSAGEWALMVCVLRAGEATTDIPTAALERMYSQADPTQLLIGSGRATALEWVKVTAQITAAIAEEKGRVARMTLAEKLHQAFGRFNDVSNEKICPCMTCNPAIWRTLDR
jgi:hypothetical protein